MGRWLNGAQKVRAAMDTAGAALDDAAASRAVPLYPTLQGDGALIRAGTRINWNGTLKRAAVDLWDVPKNAPGQCACIVGGDFLPRRIPNHSGNFCAGVRIRKGRMRLVERRTVQVGI